MCLGGGREGEGGEGKGKGNLIDPHTRDLLRAVCRHLLSIIVAQF